jgi:universal stress protein A
MPAYQRALVALDLADDARHLIDRARRLLADGGALLAAHVIEPVYDAYGFVPALATRLQGLDALALKDAQQRLTSICEDAGIGEADRYLLRGHAAVQLLTLARDERVDLLVVGTRRRRGIAALVGSTARLCANRAHCDVVVVRLDGPPASDSP